MYCTVLVECINTLKTTSLFVQGAAFKQHGKKADSFKQQPLFIQWLAFILIQLGQLLLF